MQPPSEHLHSQLGLEIGLNDPQWVQFLRKWLFISLILHLVAGVMSIGFYDMDEQFQVMEFVSFKLGRSQAAALPHEFYEHCRSWLQPTIYEMIARYWGLIGITSPAFWAASFRIFSGLLGWLGLVGMSLCSYRWIPRKRYRELAVKLTALLYFLPYLHARTSSENLGGTFFVLALSTILLFWDKKSKVISNVAAGCGGLLLGLSFLSRFQMGFMIFGFGIWCLVIARIRLKSLILIFLGILVTVGLGVILDWRGTGVWTFSPYNYFFSFQKDQASPNMGFFPWWGYFRFLAGDVPLLGNLIAAGVIAGWIAKPRNPLTFATVPFVIVHMAISHKEPRYLFPLISMVPLLLAFGIELIDRIFLKWKKWSDAFPWRMAKTAILVLNGGGLVVATLKPAATQPMLHSFVFDHQEEISKLQFINNNPFELTGLPLNFYRPAHLEVQQTSYLSLAERIQEEKQPQWLYYPQIELPPEAGKLREQCRLEYTVFPNWLRTFLFLPGIRISSKASVYKCNSQKLETKT